MSWVARAELIFSSDNLSLQLERIPETLPIPTFDRELDGVYSTSKIW